MLSDLYHTEIPSYKLLQMQVGERPFSAFTHMPQHYEGLKLPITAFCSPEESKNLNIIQEEFWSTHEYSSPKL